MTAPTMLDLALAYARRGVQVFPLAPNVKVPAIPEREGGRGHLDRTCVEATIRAWWTRWPEANLGGCPGDVGCLAFDLDTPEAWDTARRFGLLAEPTLEVTTKKGVHLWFRAPRALLSAHDLNGVVVRGLKGYCVLPGSRVDGFTYTASAEITNPCTAALELPPDAAAALTHQTGEDGRRERVREAFRPVVTAAGGRHERLVTVAAKLCAHGLERDLVQTLVHSVNAALCDPPKPAHEVTRLVDDLVAREAARRAEDRAKADAFVAAHAPARPAVVPARRAARRTGLADPNHHALVQALRNGTAGRAS